MQNEKYSVVFSQVGIFTVAYLFMGDYEPKNNWGTGFTKQDALKQLRSRRSRVRKQKQQSTKSDNVID